MAKKVVVIDYGIGNVFSVCNALLKIGSLPVLTDDPSVVEKADRVILPGVGAFSKAMNNLKQRGLDRAITNFVGTGRPFLGVCIGMQVLMEYSFESGKHRGLGLIEGGVERIPTTSIAGKVIKVPHVGWGNVFIKDNWADRDQMFFTADSSYFYFLHSYACMLSYVGDLVGTVHYDGNSLAAIICRDNIVGVQFHPERSGEDGLKFLSHFVLRK